MKPASAIACVIYGAKSTEDRRGSIPEQLGECREAIATDTRRRLIAEYSDEAFSAYRRDRGPGLRDALQHAEDLAAEYGVAELWAQHSDRLARGDGRNARHTVEVALWALKSDVRVRTLQDPDTFRDLLYAVVTGQRNNEDSKRKALSSQAGRKRAIARGEYVGHLPDGYRIHREIDNEGRLRRRIELDPERQPLIELLFRLALRGRSTGQVAKAINDRGWLTKPVKRVDKPRPFDVGKVYELLKNPRYAALSVYRGEVLARGHWPAYITERQHERIERRLTARPRARPAVPLDAFLLRGLASCGCCGHRMRVACGRARKDGTRPRSYVCSSHRANRGWAQCPAAPVGAHMAEAMVIANLPILLGSDPQEIDTRQFSKLHPYQALSRDAVISQRTARELVDTARMREWIESEKQGRTEVTRVEARELQRMLASWFSKITIEVSADTVTISAFRRHGEERLPAVVEIDRAAWSRNAPSGHLKLRRGDRWDRVEIIGALQAWADRRGCSPRQVEWQAASPWHPGSAAVCNAFGGWNAALRRAGLKPVPRSPRQPWTDGEIISALRRWARRHGRSPIHIDWLRGAPEHPNAQTTCRHFGSWKRALAAAALDPTPRPPSRGEPWSTPDLIGALRDATEAQGRPPTSLAWVLAAPEHPCATTVRKRFGTWKAALAAAGL